MEEINQPEKIVKTEQKSENIEDRRNYKHVVVCEACGYTWNRIAKGRDPADFCPNPSCC